jgi:hypothetical protein
VASARGIAHTGQMRRRQFIAGTGLVGAGAVAGLAGCEPDRAAPARPAAAAAPPDLSDWGAVRAEFDLDPAWAHFAAFVLAAHPRPVRQAIETHRHGLDVNTEDYLRRQERRLEDRVLAAAATYLGAEQGEIALTDSTTMGLGLLWGRRSAWKAVAATIPTFDFRGGRSFGAAMTPGGYHSFEHN